MSDIGHQNSLLKLELSLLESQSKMVVFITLQMESIPNLSGGIKKEEMALTVLSARRHNISMTIKLFTNNGNNKII